MERPALLLLLLLLGAARAQTHFSVVAARRVRPNSDYQVAVSLWGGAQPASVFVELSARLDSGRSFSASESLVVEPGATRLARLRVGDEGPGSYRLLARAAGEAPFVDSAPLEYEARAHSLLIQTDRAVYRPGDSIRFRCLVMDSELRPSRDARLQLHIVDGQGNRIQQWSEPRLQQGVFSGELQLSRSPVLGDWQIVASAGADSASRPLQVAEYVLPSFEVSIDAPAHASFEQAKIGVSVRASYSNGKPVRGELTVTAFPDIYSSLIQPIYQTPPRKSLKIRGSARLDFDLARELGVTGDDYARPLVIEAAVEEEASGRRQNASLRVTLHKHSHRMELLRDAEHYKPGLKFSALLRVRQHDGAPPSDRGTPVLVSYGFGQQLVNVTRTLDERGEAQLDFWPPADATDGQPPLRVEAHYLDLHERFPSTSAAGSRSGSHLQAALLTTRPRVGDLLRVEVNCTEPLRRLSYQLLGRGRLLDSATVEVAGGRSASLQFLASPDMAPAARLLVYYARPDGELVADSLELRLDGALRNFLEVRALAEHLAPGDDLELSVSAEPGSFVGLMAVDQNAALLGSGNDISRDRVRRELLSYAGAASEDLGDGEEDEEALAWTRLGSASAEQAFRSAGSVVLTNGYVPENAQPTAEEADRLKDPTQAQSISTIRPDIGPPVRYKFPTRPGWAGRWAFSYVPLSNWRPRVFLAHDVSDTWLFSNVTTGLDGKTVVRGTVPDSLTSWVLTGFSLDAASGLGLMQAPTKLRVSKAFFVSLNLPHSVIRGEALAIPVVVSNHMPAEMLVEVVLENSGDFEFAEAPKRPDGGKRLELYRAQKLLLAGNATESVSFVIVPTRLGHISLRAKASGALAGDSTERTLLVKPAGETRERSQTLLVDLRQRERAEASLALHLPRHLVEGSEHAELSAAGDPLAASLPNLSRLLPLPVDSAEQSVLNLAANVVALEHLRASGRLSAALQRRAEGQLREAYQQQLTYRHPDGSFSAFGRADAGGSTWLTAHAARWLGRARAWIHVDERVVGAALDWLVARQAPDGGFPEAGARLRADSRGPALSAFALVSLLEAGGAGRREAVRRGAEHVARGLAELRREDVLALALSCYALGLARSDSEDEAFRRLQASASVDAERGLRWWAGPGGAPRPRAVDVEASAYALLCYERRGLLTEGLDVMRWLLAQRNGQGGFVSTQDTAVGLLALSQLGRELASSPRDLSISAWTDQAERKDIRISSQNFLVAQKHVLLGKTRAVNITASGSGLAFVQLTARYNLNVTGARPRFALDPQVDAVSTPSHLQLSVCSSFPPSKEANESNMAVMEVSLPSGFGVDREALPSLELSQHVKRVESREADGLLVLYFEKMGRQDYCPTVSAHRTHALAEQRPVPVSVYDYYEPSRRARVFYEPRASALCDICEGQQCGEACGISAGKRQRDSQASTSSGGGLLAALPLLLLPSWVAARSLLPGALL